MINVQYSLYYRSQSGDIHTKDLDCGPEGHIDQTAGHARCRALQLTGGEGSAGH